MNKRLDSLLQDTYTVEDLERKITSDIKAKSSNEASGEPYYEDEDLITPDISELPVVTITLAIPLTKEEIVRLGQWFRRQVNPRVLLNIRRDPKIIGGCKIIWQGIEGDFSLRKKLRESRRQRVEVGRQDREQKTE